MSAALETGLKSSSLNLWGSRNEVWRRKKRDTGRRKVVAPPQADWRTKTLQCPQPRLVQWGQSFIKLSEVDTYMGRISGFLDPRCMGRNWANRKAGSSLSGANKIVQKNISHVLRREEIQESTEHNGPNTPKCVTYIETAPKKTKPYTGRRMPGTWFSLDSAENTCVVLVVQA